MAKEKTQKTKTKKKSKCGHQWLMNVVSPDLTTDFIRIIMHCEHCGEIAICDTKLRNWKQIAKGVAATK